MTSVSVAARASNDDAARILIIEDDIITATLIEASLTDAGYVVIGIAASGLEALALAAADNVTLALVDILLTGPFDGIEVACLLRDKHAIPSIFLSGLNDADTLLRAHVAAPLGYLQKPFCPSQVFNAIHKALLDKASGPAL